MNSQKRLLKKKRNRPSRSPKELPWVLTHLLFITFLSKGFKGVFVAGLEALLEELKTLADCFCFFDSVVCVWVVSIYFFPNIFCSWLFLVLLPVQKPRTGRSPAFKLSTTVNSSPRRQLPEVFESAGNPRPRLGAHLRHLSRCTSRQFASGLVPRRLA